MDPQLKQACQELLATERQYLLDLREFSSHFIAAFHRDLPSLRVSAATAETLGQSLGHWDQIELFHGELLATLEGTCGREGVVGPGTPELLAAVFASHAPYLKMYSEFIALYTPAAAALQREAAERPAFRAWLTAFQQRSPRRLGALDYLIKPVQRICKYPLLFREIGRHMRKASGGGGGFDHIVDDGADDEAYMSVVLCLSVIEDAVRHVNSNQDM